MKAIDLVELGLGGGIFVKLLLMLIFEVLDDLAVVILVWELDIFEEKASHRKLQLICLLHLLPDLLTKLGQSCCTFCRIIIDVPLSSHRTLL